MNDVKLEGIVKNLNILERCIFFRANHMGSWLRVWDNMVTGTVLSAMEFCNFLCAHYNITPLNLKK